jgi:hypothetical protein
MVAVFLELRRNFEHLQLELLELLQKVHLAPTQKKTHLIDPPVKISNPAIESMKTFPFVSSLGPHYVEAGGLRVQ